MSVSMHGKTDRLFHALKQLRVRIETVSRHQYSTPSDHKGKSQLEDAATTASEWRRRNPRGAVARPSWYRQEADACESVSAPLGRVLSSH
jgi:hypothetical protein